MKITRENIRRRRLSQIGYSILCKIATRDYRRNVGIRETVTDSNRIADSIIKKFACSRATGMLRNYEIFLDRG